MRTEEANAAGETLEFPADFLWGAATAAYQIEGATRDDGRGDSIWDTFCRTPGKVYKGHTGEVACDHYHRYREDIALLAELGIPAYRFSVAWPRVQPDGSGPVNPRGMDFYDRLVDTLAGYGITPVLTLYHWDLPQTLEDRGGWVARDTAERFAEYALVVCRRLADRVPLWVTLNEPWCAAFFGYGSGVHAPGRTDLGAAFTAAHHLLVAHGLGAQALRAEGAAQVSLVLNLAPVVAVRAVDAPAADHVDGLQNRLFLDAVLRAGYPADVLRIADGFTGLSHIRPGDEELIAQPLDLLGVNYYAPIMVRASPGAPGDPAYPGTEGVAFLPPAQPITAMGWAIQPDGLAAVLSRVHADYPGVPLLITENGAAFDDRVGDDGRVADPDRIAYLAGHIRAAHDALRSGVDLRGYLVWSLLDNFEWSLGYGMRFGIVYVDYATQRRLPKDSAHWFGGVVRRGGA